MSRLIECRSKTVGQQDTWFLQEISDSGSEIGPELTPWEWGCSFIVSSYEIHSGVHIDNHSLPRLNHPISSLGASEIDFESIKHDITTHVGFRIQAEIEPNPDDKRTYEFFGTEQKIEKFTLRICKSDHDICRVSCIPGYSYELDFKNFREGDNIEILMDCSPKTLKNVLKIFENADKRKISLFLRSVRCFYSRDQIGISTDLIKVISDEKDHPVKFVSGNEIKIPRDGFVREFSLHTSEFLDVGKSDAGTAQFEQKTTPEFSEKVTNIVLPNNFDQEIGKIMKEIRSIRTPLWLLLIIGVFALFTR